VPCGRSDFGSTMATPQPSTRVYRTMCRRSMYWQPRAAAASARSARAPLLQDLRDLGPKRNPPFLAPLPLQLDVTGGPEGDVSLTQRDGLEDVASAIAPVCKLRKREDAIMASVIDVDVEQLHERSLVRIRQRSQEHGVHDAEECGRRADVKRDSQGDDRRKAGSLPDGPKPVPKILKYRNTGFGRGSGLNGQLIMPCCFQGGPVSGRKRSRRGIEPTAADARAGGNPSVILADTP
jgi:hypothetical protein